MTEDRATLTEDERELIEGQVEVEGFDYAFSECLRPKDYKDQRLKELHQAFLDARRKLATYLDMEDHV